MKVAIGVDEKGRLTPVSIELPSGRYPSSFNLGLAALAAANEGSGVQLRAAFAEIPKSNRHHQRSRGTGLHEAVYGEFDQLRNELMEESMLGVRKTNLYEKAIYGIIYSKDDTALFEGEEARTIYAVALCMASVR